MADDLYLEPNRKSQIIFLLVVILAVLLYASIDPIINYLTPSRDASLEELKAGVKSLTLFNIGARVLGVFILLIWAAFFVRQGFRTLKSGSYPPSGAFVIWRTKINTGRQATLEGYYSFLFGVAYGLLAIFEVYKIWLVAKLLTL